MRVVIAPDKFKGSLSAPEVASRLSTGLRAGFAAGPGVDLKPRSFQWPTAAKGPSTPPSAPASPAAAPRSPAPSGQPITSRIRRPRTRKPSSKWRRPPDSPSAGLRRWQRPNSETAKSATSLGTGELIRAALDLGCRKIILGVGGSANTDAGAGVLQGLGAVFLDKNGNELPGGGAALARLETIDFSNFDVRIEATEFVLASDVDNPLLGAQRSPSHLRSAKGRDAGRRRRTRRGAEPLRGRPRSNNRPTSQVRSKVRSQSRGAGAAGGVGYIAIAALKAERRPGIDVVLEFTDLEQRLKGADLVITGEGSLDEQSLLGKTPMGVSRAAQRNGVPVIAVCGRSTLSPEQLTDAGFHTVHALTDLEKDVEQCIAQAGPLLEQLGKHIGVCLAEADRKQGATPCLKKHHARPL